MDQTPRKRLRSVNEYAAKLPEGAALKFSDEYRTFTLYERDTKKKLGQPKTEEEVLMWTNPARVFAYIARREKGIR